MLAYVLRRGLIAVLLAWAALTVSFLLMQASPGDAADRYLSPETSPATMALIRKNFGLDEPMHVQYLKWVGRFLQGDFGMSLSRHRPVASVLKEAIPPTLQLTMTALFLSILLGTLIGAAAALKRRRWPDRLLTGGALAIYCMPSFWLALMLVMLFAVELQWLPASHGSSLFAAEEDGWSFLLDRLRHMILPVLTMTLAGAAATARYVRESLDSMMRSDFLQLARAKGLSERQVISRHALRHALLPVISFLGYNFPFLLGGAFVIETVFAWPGMGRVTFEAAFARDYPIVLATNGISALMIIAGNFMADILYKLADPRIQT
jgi:peptide/nickel transport system permease protein